MTKIILILFLLISTSTHAEDWQFLLNRYEDNKPIEMDFSSVKTDRGLIYLDIRFSPIAGMRSLFSDISHYKESIVVDCQKESFAVATEIELLKNGSQRIISVTQLPDLNYIRPNQKTNEYRVLNALCKASKKSERESSSYEKKQPINKNLKSRLLEKKPDSYDWRFVANGIDGDNSLLINIESIQRLANDSVLFLYQQKFTEINKTPQNAIYKNVIGQLFISCKENTVIETGQEYYNDNYELVDMFHSEMAEFKTQTIDKGSLFQSIKDVSCRIGLSKEEVKTNNDESVGGASGTAWQISDYYLVTAQHVINGGKDIKLVTPEKELIDVKVVAEDQYNDIAIIKVNKLLKSKALNISAKLPKLGSKVAVLGYPLSSVLGYKIQATSGEISALTGIADDRRFYQITAPIQPGNSGGPLLNQEGDVIGIVSSKLNDKVMLEASGIVPQNVNFALKFPYVKALIDSVGLDLPSKQKKLNSIEQVIDYSKDSVYLILIR